MKNCIEPTLTGKATQVIYGLYANYDRKSKIKYDLSY